MEKIEKLKIFFKEDDISFEKVVIEKINEIIDYLNSQAQPEEKEEWEKRFIRTFGYWGEEIKFIKQLLKEREKEASEEVIRDLIKKIEDAHCDSISLELLKDII